MKKRSLLILAVIGLSSLGLVGCNNGEQSKDGKIAIYYGCADTVVGLCFTTIDETVDFIKAHNELNYWDTDEGRF